MTTGGGRGAVVLGARNLGRAVAARLLADGWNVAAVARSDETLAAVAEQGALALKADAADPPALAAALETAAERHGGLDLIVNAVHPQRPPEASAPWGGPLADLDLAAYRGWGSAVAEQAYVFLHAGIRALTASGGGALVQVTGGSAIRPAAGRAAWSAGCHAARALVLAAHEELRDGPINPYVVVIEGPITSDDERAEIARSIVHLAEPRLHRTSPELVLR